MNGITSTVLQPYANSLNELPIMVL